MAEPPRAVQRVRRALVRGDLPAALRLAGRLRGAAHVPARSGRRGRRRRAPRGTWPGCRTRRRTRPRCRPTRPSTRPPSVLGGQRFRLRRPGRGDAGQWLAAEKGYLREVGNLLFHLSLLGVLLSIAVGGLFGYKADELVVEGDRRSATPPPRWTSSTRGGWSRRPTSRRSRSRSTSSRPTTSTRAGPSGSPQSFNANVDATRRRRAAPREDVRHPGQPPAVGRLGEGVPDRARVRADVQGDGPQRQVAYDEATPFIPANTNTHALRRRGEGARAPRSASWACSCRPRYMAERDARVDLPGRQQPGGVADRLLRQPRHELRARRRASTSSTPAR